MISSRIADITSQIKQLFEFMKLTKGFRVSERLTENVKVMAQLVKDGQNDDAVKTGNEVLRAGRGILGAFLRNSVVDQEATATSPARPARFTKEIGWRAKNDDGPYDGDIIARLEKKREELLLMVKGGEYGPIFTERIRAYNAMVAALEIADAEQKQLDRTRAETARMKMMTGEMLATRGQATTPKSTDRAEALVVREQAAADLLSIL